MQRCSPNNRETTVSHQHTEKGLKTKAALEQDLVQKFQVIHTVANATCKITISTTIPRGTHIFAEK